MAENKQNELLLLENVFLKLGLAETDEQLAKCLDRFLCPVLLKLASIQPGVKEKILEMLHHITKRLKSRNQVALPLNQLVAQLCNPDTEGFVLNFTIVFLKIGFPRVDRTTQTEQLAALLKSYTRMPPTLQNSILQLVLPCFEGLVLPKELPQKKALLGLNEKPELAPELLDFILQVLLLPYNFMSVVEKLRAKNSGGSSTAASAATNSPNPGGTGEDPVPPPEPSGPPAGLDESVLMRFVTEPPMSADSLEQIKLGMLNILSAEIYEEPDVLCHLVLASADNRHSVSSAADRELKRILGAQDWNRPELIRKLYSIFQGTTAAQAKQLKADKLKAPASIQMRLKIFPFLLKSKEAASQFPACLQMTCDCLFGKLTNKRLKHLAVQFIHHLCLYCPAKIFNVIGPVLLSSLTPLIKNTQEDVKLRSMLYVAIAKIVRQLPHLVANDIGLLQSFFEAVCQEESENRLAVQEALSMMSTAFTSMTPANRLLLEALIMQNVEQSDVPARLAAVQYAHTVFPRDHIPSRYVLLLACGDRNESVALEAKKALTKAWAQESATDTSSPAQKKRKSEEPGEQTRLLPSFQDIVAYLQDKSQVRLKSASRYTQGNQVLAFHPSAYTEILGYLQACLAYSAGLEPQHSSDREVLQSQAPSLRRYALQQLEQDPSPGAPLRRYLAMLRQLLAINSGTLPLSCLPCLLQLVAIAREVISREVYQDLQKIKVHLSSSVPEVRELAAELFALVVVYGSEDQSAVQEHLDTHINGLRVDDKQAYIQNHASLLCLGYVVAYHSRREGGLQHGGMETDSSAELGKIRQRVIQQLAEFVGSPDVLLSVAACSSLGEVGRATVLPLADTHSEGEALSKQSLVESLLKKVRTHNVHNKLREAAATTLGHLCVGEVSFPYRRNVIDGLLESYGPKQIELHLTIGEALCCAALGSYSPQRRDAWVQPQPDNLGVGSENNDVETLLTLLMKKYISSLNPHARQAACIWLLALARQCGEVKVIQDNLLSIQCAFRSLLSENDEITQDIASKGLGVVYEKCSKEQKETLVSSLVNTLTTGKKETQKVEGNTQLFDEGQLGKTPDGKSLTTYKELCSIANDLNQPDLIYKFMHLANHQATWNSKKGAAFGFSTIAAQAGEQLAPYLHQIVPKLYRYQFDPNAKIQLAMSSIWNALVQDNKKTIEKYEKEIAADLLLNLTHVQWRVRESSCLALSDFLRGGRSLEGVVGVLPQLWASSFRVLDDIKESVRKAAEMACRSLSKASIKICDASQGSVGAKATSLVLPCLIETGLVNQVKEVRAFSLATILEISKTAGVLLKPHIPLLVCSLLEALSSLEPQYLNYVSLHVAADEQAQNKLDSARAAASKTSPMMEVINLCIPHIDSAVLTELVPRLVDLIKSGVGLSTKTGTSDLLVQLCTHNARDLEPHAGKLLLALLSGLSDRNLTVKRRYGMAVGHIVKIAKESSVEKLLHRLKGWYLEKEEESARQACAITIHAITARSVDIIKAHGALALPLAYLAMHEKPADDESKSNTDATAMTTLWEEVWADATPGTEAGLKLYLQEIVELSRVALDSQSWRMKAQGAATLAAMATKLGAQLGPPHLGALLSALVAALAGRTWQGKEALIKAIATVCVSCKEALSVDREGQPTIEEVLTALQKECAKTNFTYKMEALENTGKILEAYRTDKFAEVFTILFPMLEKRKERDDDIVQATWLTFEEKAVECLGRAWPLHRNTQEKYYQACHTLMLTLFSSCVCKVQVEILKFYAQFIKTLYLFESSETASQNRTALSEICRDIVPYICKSLGNKKYGSVRIEAVAAIEVLSSRLQECDQIDIIRDMELQAPLIDALNTLSSDNVPGLESTAQTVLKRIQSS